MTHFLCKGTCNGTLEDMGICETEGCTNQWEMMEECNCTDGLHGAGESAEIVKDSNGNILQDGDSVTCRISQETLNL